MHIALEGEHVGCAAHLVFAGGLEGDIVGEEAGESGVEELIEAVLPDGGAVGLYSVSLGGINKTACVWSTNIVVHVGGAEDKYARVVGKLSIVDIGAVRLDVSAVVDAVIVVHEPDTPHPVPRRFGPVGVRLVSGVARQSGAEVEETACTVLGQLKIHRI